jgi:hypothetical protein
VRAGSRHIGAGLTLLSFAVAFLQRPGEATSDTKIDLHVEPIRFLGEVASVWSSSGGLGQVHAGQYSGYLFPMGPFFALGELVGLAPWVVHRLWLGTLLALAAWGTVKLLDALLEEPRGAAQVVAGALMVVNPYVATFAQATSVTLLGYAALPWLVLAVHRGLRNPRGWWWPALFALAFTSTGGGVNAAVTGWLLLGPALLLLYEWRAGMAGGRAAWALAWRTGVASIATSVWWLVPVAVHAALGINFLPFTESAGAIWATTSVPESLRLMGYWLSYLGAGFGERPLPYFDAGDELLFSAPVVVASLLVPALALAGLVRSRRWAYAPFFLLLLLAGLLVMSAGFPEGTPLRRALTFTYNHVEGVQFLRTTYKAGPLVALAIACLAGAGARAIWPRIGRHRPARLLAPIAAAGLVALAAWPLTTGRALDPKFTWEEIPSPWRDAAADVDARLGERDRGLVLPGQLYGFYEWGATVDPILPVLAEEPVSSRTAVPYADLHAVDLLWTVDSLVQQERAVPGQLEPLLGWLGVGAVVTGTDDDVERSGAVAPAEAARALAIGGLGEGATDAAYGPQQLFWPDIGSATPITPLRQVRRYDISGSGFVRLQPREPDLLVDGSAEALAGLAAFGSLRPGTAVSYAGDQGDDALPSAASSAGELVISDSNRRRVVSPSRPRQGSGRTLAADEPVPVDAPVLEPFEDAGTDAQTVAVVAGAEALRSPFAPGFSQYPEHRPYAAFDGDPSTWWEADRELRDSSRWVEVRFERPRAVAHVDVLPRREDRTDVTEVEVAGRRFPVEPGWNRLELDLPAVDGLRVRVARRSYPDDLVANPGALAEVRVPGLRVEEALRPPTRLESAIPAGAATTVTYLFQRTTADRPFRRHPSSPRDAASIPEDGSVEAVLIREARDPERVVRRRIAPPAGRVWTADAWVSIESQAPDAAIDELLGVTGRAAFDSSGRFEGRPAFRASRAFDRRPDTAWVGRLDDGGRAWIDWRGGGPGTLRVLQLVRAPTGVLPSRVRLRWRGGGATPPLLVPDGGRVVLPDGVPAAAGRLEIVEARGAPGAAVGIAEIRAGGLPRAPGAAYGRVRSRCGDVRVESGGRTIALRVEGRLGALGAPLRARSCGPPVALPGGEQTLTAAGGLFDPYLVRVRSASTAARVPGAAGRVLDAGQASGGSRDGVRLDPAGPARLVLAESFNEGWRAWCGDAALGEPSIADGWANGWDVGADCRDVRFEFGPERVVRAGYALSGAACLVLLVLLLVRRRARGPLVRPAARRGEVPLPPRPPARALALALAVASGVAFVFALRAGAVALPLLAVLFWRGASVTALLTGAGALLVVVVPVLYLVFPPEDLGGHNSSYPAEALGAHWVAVGALVLLGLALWRMLAGRARGTIH